MMKQPKDERFVVFNTRTNKPVGMDMSTGGYPYDVDYLWDAHLFTSEEGAWNWAKIVWDFGPYTVMGVKLQMRVINK